MEAFGRIDIYVFDQLLRGRITPGHRILDAGCGTGRNAHYLIACGANLHGVDQNEASVAELRDLAGRLRPGFPASNFQVASLDAIPHEDRSFDVVVCSAVLHFADDEAHFEAILDELWRILVPGGLLFARLASSIGIEQFLGNGSGRRFQLPDGTERFLVDESFLDTHAKRLNGRLLDPLKTTNVHNLRAMTTWVLGKPA